MPFSIILQYLLPKVALTTLAGKLANLKAGKLTTVVIGWFVRRYQVNMAEAVNTDIASYSCFNEFFTRPLHPNARPIAKAEFICPVDGTISQFGSIKKDQVFQAKGHYYSTLALVAGQQSLASKFENGFFACLYLSPKDYHRIHMPCDGTLVSMTYVPGDLLSVNPNTANNVPNLFARNERVVCEFESDEHGAFVMVLVGATIVGSMATVWHEENNGIVNPERSGRIQSWSYEGQNKNYEQGDEMGRFLLGSTVVMLFQKDTLCFNSDWQPARKIQLGEAMAFKQT